MITGYVILGCVLIVMSVLQIWLRWGPWAKEQKAAEQAAAERRKEMSVSADSKEASDEKSGEAEPPERAGVYSERGLKLWTKWTAILGPLGMAFGLFLLVWGLVGE